jgi:hypothetical protein
LPKALLAEEHFRANEEGRYSECAAVDRRSRIVNKLCFDSWILSLIDYLLVLSH